MTRVYVDIVGDLFHIGHINLFKQAKLLFDDTYLIVGIHSDRDVESYKRTPIICQENRYEVIRHCCLVDEIIEAAPLCLDTNFINKNNIDYVVHGDDMSASLEDQHKIIRKMNIVKYVEYTKGISTSQIINRIQSRKTSYNKEL
tara:strand:+ start:76 stop:507 length:432 start_codon:yes stop_codon:yes gene_type:complete